MENTEKHERLRRHVDELAARTMDAHSLNVDFWKHLTIVEATVLGLTVGLASGVPSWPLVCAWLMLLLAIAIGCLLVRMEVDQTVWTREWAADYMSSLEKIEQLVGAGLVERGSSEESELELLALQRAGPRHLWSDEASAAREANYGYRLGERHQRGEGGVSQLLRRNTRRVQRSFYVFSLIALVLLGLGVASGPFRRSLAEQPLPGKREVQIAPTPATNLAGPRPPGSAAAGK